MPKFLTRAEIYRILQRELPLGVFPDGAPSAYYHTAEMDSVAKTLETAYTSASGIYQNSFPQTCDESKINAFELKYFGELGDSSMTLAERQARILIKAQTKRGITKSDMESVVNYTVPGLDFEIVAWCCGEGEGGWVLDVSQLDIETYLNYDVQFAGPVGPTLCSDSPAKWGMTQAEWDILRTFAYTFEVRIYNQTLTTAQRAALNAALAKAEPARSTHVINDGLTEADRLDGDT